LLSFTGFSLLVTFFVSFFLANAFKKSFLGVLALFFLSVTDTLIAYLMDDGFYAFMVEFLSFSGCFLKT